MVFALRVLVDCNAPHLRIIVIVTDSVFHALQWRAGRDDGEQLLQCCLAVTCK
jgi:hypothetical protein